MADLYTDITSFVHNIGMGVFNNALAEGRERRARRENYQLNEQAAENAQKRQWETINQFYTPQAQLRQLKEAGLSPSLMYGGEGTAGQSVAPQGAGTSGIAPNYQTILNMAQVHALEAQANLQNAQARTVEGKNERGQLELAKLFEEKGLFSAQKRLTDAQATNEEFTNRVNNATEEDQINKIIWECQTAEEDYYNALWTAKTNEIKFEITQETKEAAIEEAQNKAALLFEQILKTRKDIQVENAQINKIKEEVSSIIYQRSLDYFDRQIYQADVNSQISWRNNQAKLMAKELEMKMKQFNISMDFEKFKLGTETKVNIFQGCMSAVGMASAGAITKTIGMNTAKPNPIGFSL